MIREARLEDVSVITRMSIAFLKEADVLSTIPLNELHLQQWIINLINAKLSTCLVYEEDGTIKGAIAGIISPHYINNNYLVASEFAWWVIPGYRGKVGKPLLKAFEVWAKANNANAVQMVALDKLNPDIMDKFYKSVGYTSTEFVYIKEI